MTKISALIDEPIEDEKLIHQSYFYNLLHKWIENPSFNNFVAIDVHSVMSRRHDQMNYGEEEKGFTFLSTFFRV